MSGKFIRRSLSEKVTSTFIMAAHVKHVTRFPIHGSEAFILITYEEGGLPCPVLEIKNDQNLPCQHNVICTLKTALHQLITDTSLYFPCMLMKPAYTAIITWALKSKIDQQNRIDGE